MVRYVLSSKVSKSVHFDIRWKGGPLCAARKAVGLHRFLRIGRILILFDTFSGSGGMAAFLFPVAGPQRRTRRGPEKGQIYFKRRTKKDLCGKKILLSCSCSRCC